ncbi:MAG TPA: hypothetical protein VGG48_05410 [Rhizomicrobium sp.]|jgi:hypothetical protein
MPKLAKLALVTAAALLALTTANAADVKTPLACKIGPPSGKGFSIQVVNATKAPLKPQTIVNIHARWKNPGSPGEIDECFVLDAPLAPGATIAHVMKFDRDQDPMDCTSFISSLHPAVVVSNGASETACD